MGFYQPLQNKNGSVIAMLIVEFSATDCYQTLAKLISGAVIILLIGAFTGILLARHRFLAISNLNHRNMHNIDQMTGFKNRNAFDLDLANINNTASYESLTIYYIDLNELKSVNDSQGHDVGDKYIEGMAEIIRESMAAGDIIYRVGGDEFCVLSFTHVSSKARSTIKRFEYNLDAYNQNNQTEYSAAIGYAIFNQHWMRTRQQQEREPKSGCTITRNV
jgi:diguanylate cyclase (GGDEF)-like protein